MRPDTRNPSELTRARGRLARLGFPGLPPWPEHRVEFRPMTISRREFAALVSSGALGFSSQEPGVERPSAERVQAMLDAHGGRGIFSEPEWLELLREALERNARTRARLRAYPVSDDAEPTIAFTRY